MKRKYEGEEEKESQYKKYHKPRYLSGIRYRTDYMAALALREVRDLKRTREKKTFDTTLAAQAFDNGATTGQFAQTLVNIAQGDTAVTRDGNQIAVHSVHIKGQVLINSTDLNQRCFVKIDLVQDRQTVADTNPGWSTVFTDTATGAATDSMLNADVRARFKVLKTWRCALAIGSGTGTSIGGDNKGCLFDCYLRFKKPLILWYNGTASTDIQRNNILLYATTDTDGATAAIADMDFKSRVVFTDA